MPTNSISVLPDTAKALGAMAWNRSAAECYVVLAGRVFYSAIFIVAAIGHFSQPTIQFAAQQGIPLPEIFVPLSGVVSFLGGLSILLGYRARLAGWLLVAFLVPVTLMMHNFWAVRDPMIAQLQQVMFMKNLSMMGAALLIAHFGAGPLSLDAEWQDEK